MGISISSGGDLETLPQQALPHNCVASCIKSSTSSGCQEVHFNTNERPQQALQHNRVSSSVVVSISSHGDLETLPQEALPHNHVASSIKSSTSSGGDLETLAQQALQCNCVVAAYIGKKDLENLTLQALPHDLMASSFTQSTIQSTVAQQSSQAATVLQARQPEVVLARPTRSWGCRGAARRCISILKRGINKPSGITGWPPPSDLHQQSWGFRNLASASPPA
ncbi:hypothetical protein AAY473_037227 [Plecturocebus cupreus]